MSNLAERIEAKRRETRMKKEEIRQALDKLPRGHYRVKFFIGCELDFLVSKGFFFGGVEADLIEDGQRKQSTEWTPREVNLIHSSLEQIMKAVEEQYAE